MVHPHFVELRDRIRKQLPDHSMPPPKWLYGALGESRSDVMFICEYPSERGVEYADRYYRHTGIEAQWRNDVFRDVLVECDLKLGGRDTSGGWRCYITNFIKQVDKASVWAEKPKTERLLIAERWLGVLKWEISRVKPQTVFCVGERVWSYVKFFQRKGRLLALNPHRIWSYSARRRDLVREKMNDGIRKGLDTHIPGPETPSHAGKSRS